MEYKDYKEYNYNRIFFEIRQTFNRTALIWTGVMATIVIVMYVLYLFKLVTLDSLTSLMWLMPATIIFLLLLLYCNRQVNMLTKKQKLAIMAYQARQSLENLQTFPDASISDSRIKMHYLAKNGIDIDRALKRMEGDVNRYNKLILAFIAERHRTTEELSALMSIDKLLQYGAKAHVLRVKANAIGILDLTDTAFFHEIEAYAGNLNVIQANWEKLTSELDKSCEILNEYIQALGPVQKTSDSVKSQMTFKEWGEQLQEVFNALEVYDIVKAKKILNKLMQYHIDADINKNLENILANIDDIMRT